MKGQIVHTGATIEEIVEMVQRVLHLTPEAPTPAARRNMKNPEVAELGSSREEVLAWLKVCS